MMKTDGPRLLVVDDEPQLLRAITPALIAAGYQVSTADTGAGALAALAAEGADAVILDLGLPDMDGKAVIKRVREWSETPIVVLSARDIEQEKIEALDLGADDFVNKPFAIGELMARLRAAMRGRERRFLASAQFFAGELHIDFAARRVFLQDQEVRLTPREYDLLRTLARHAGQVLTHKHLMAAVWGDKDKTDVQFVRVLVGQLRQKLEEDASAPRILVTEPGIGYRLQPEDET
jgi:two-component system KDP operon response regulator KdpE